jgi:hypothetical protein
MRNFPRNAHEVEARILMQCCCRLSKDAQAQVSILNSWVENMAESVSVPLSVVFLVACDFIMVQRLRRFYYT